MFIFKVQVLGSIYTIINISLPPLGVRHTQLPGHLCQQVFRSNEQTYLSHRACHAVCLSFPRKADTESQPVNAWQHCKPNARGPSAFDFS